MIIRDSTVESTSRAPTCQWHFFLFSHNLCLPRTDVIVLGYRQLKQRLHERSFICNRIVFDAVTPSVYTTPIETIAETGSIWKRCQKWSVFKTIRFYLSCKPRNRIDLNTVTILARHFVVRFKMVNLARSEGLAYTMTTLIFWRKRFRVNTSKPHRFRYGFEIV